MDNSENTNVEIKETEPNIEQPEAEKQSTKTFTQSEADKLVAEQLKKEREKFGDYETVKQELEALRKAQKDRELSEMSELEKHKAMLEEIEKSKRETEQQLFEYKKKEAVSQILSDQKYSKLPPIYRQAVKYSENTEDMAKSADEMLSQFEKDTGTLVKSTFGISDPPVDPVIKSVNGVVKSAGDMQGAIRAKLLEKLKTRS